MDYTTIYMIGFILTVAAFAARARDVEARALFIIAAAWPLSMTFAALMFSLRWFNADFDVQESNVRFGYRWATNPKVRGFAVTLFNNEFQLYQFRKLVD